MDRVEDAVEQREEELLSPADAAEIAPPPAPIEAGENVEERPTMDEEPTMMEDREREEEPASQQVFEEPPREREQSRGREPQGRQQQGRDQQNRGRGGRGRGGRGRGGQGRQDQQHAPQHAKHPPINQSNQPPSRNAQPLQPASPAPIPQPDPAQ